MNVVTELRKQAKANYEAQLREAELVLDSVKANLSIEDGKDAEMLKFFGTQKIVTEQKRNVASAKGLINSEYVTEENVKTICLNYNLRFLNASYYKKEIPSAVLNDMRRFKEENKLSDWQLERNLMVIAPASHFNLGPRPAKDPVLLFKTDYGYKVISTWGNDFNSSRRVQGFVATFPNTVLFFIVAIISLMVCLYFRNESRHIWWAMATPLAVMIVIFIINEDCAIESLDERWDTPYKNSR